MSEVNTVAANQLMVLGGGLTIDDYGQLMLHQHSTERADRTIEYYYEEEARFLARGAMIVCTGGHSHGQNGEYVPESQREASLIAGLLMEAEIPSRLIETETESTSTAENILNCIELGYIDPATIDPDNPLGVVSHLHHLERFIIFASKTGIHPDSIQKIPTEQEDENSMEFLKRQFYRIMLVGANDPAKLRSRIEAMNNHLGKTQSAVQNFASFF